MNTELDALKTNLDNFFLIINGSLIILMQVLCSSPYSLYIISIHILLQAGFGFLEAGSVRSKNVTKF